MAANDDIDIQALVDSVTGPGRIVPTPTKAVGYRNVISFPKYMGPLLLALVLGAVLCYAILDPAHRGSGNGQSPSGGPTATLIWYAPNGSPKMGTVTNTSTEPETIVVAAIWKDAGEEQEAATNAYDSADNTDHGFGYTIPPGKQGVIALEVPDFPVDRIEMRVTGASGATHITTVNP